MLNKTKMNQNKIKMPCKCPDIREEECDQCSFSGASAILSRQMPTHETRAPPIQKPQTFAPNHAMVRQTNSYQSRRTIIRIVDDLYEKCAAYNLRHCGFQGFVSNNNNYLSNFLKDLLLLLCFLIANSVVFLTIFTRMTIQMSLVLFESIRWVRRAVPSVSLMKWYKLKNRVRIDAQLRRDLFADSFAPHIIQHNQAYQEELQRYNHRVTVHTTTHEA